jgi:tryptophanyl-tRNA synthetase
MSKSEPDKTSKILITATPDEIHTTISRALTDSLPGITFDEEGRPGVSNLLRIISAFEGREVADVVAEVEGLSMRAFKDRAAQAVSEGLTGVRERYEEVKGRRGWVEQVREKGRERALKVARERMRIVKDLVGL